MGCSCVSNRTCVRLSFTFAILSFVVAAVECFFATRQGFTAGTLSALALAVLGVACVVTLYSDERDKSPLFKWATRACFVATSLLLLWVTLLLAIQIATPSVDAAAFPTACQPGDKPNCCRLVPTALGARDTGNLSVPVFASGVSCGSVLQATTRFVAQNDARLLVANSSAQFVHAVFQTVTFGFRDDFYVRCERWPTNTTVLVQSESRLGYSDFGTNLARVEAFVAALKAAEQ